MLRGILMGVLLLAGSVTWGQTLPPMEKWQAWFREGELGNSRVQEGTRRGEGAVVRVEHRGQKDWAFHPGVDEPVKAGDVLEMTVDVKVEGTGEAGPCLTTLKKPGDAVNWLAGLSSAKGTSEWKTMRARVVVPMGVNIVQPRVVGSGPAVVWLANAQVRRKGNILEGSTLPRGPLSIANETISVEYDPATAMFAVRDRRDGTRWEQLPLRAALLPVTAVVREGAIEADLLELRDELKLHLTITLDGQKPEFVVKLSGDGEMTEPLEYPAAFAMGKGQYLVLPMNEGISYPADDAAMPRWRLILYGGHGLCMPFYGATEGIGEGKRGGGWMAIVQTPDDAMAQLGRSEGLNWAGPVWEGQRGRWGYTREIRYVMLESGGHVAMAKRYRQYANGAGLLKTFAEKRKERPQVDKLLGAVNVWCWDQDAAPIVKEMQAAGIDRILWSNQLKAEQIRQLNALGVLTSRYDIYSDLMDPANFPKLAYKHPDWTTAGFPQDIILGKDGKPIAGWQIEEKSGSGMIPCAVLCDLKAPEYAVKRVGEELKTHAYGCRFIDTTTATPWRECYSPAHPMTRTQSREAKMKLLKVISGQYKLVCGSETGHDAAAPYCDYFEGMLSLGPYRVDDAGRHMDRIVMEVPENLRKFQVGEKYRLPLWELVYHDCCVAQWYWGDYNNKLPPIWRKRDLFNALYATPPMFMFSRRQWAEQKDRFVESYNTSAAITHATAGREMTDHRFLTDDRSVQQTSFAGGVKVTVNFGEQEYVASGMRVPGGGVLVEGLERR